ncbi:MAG: MFS transporter [Actinomycetota bacterium]
MHALTQDDLPRIRRRTLLALAFCAAASSMGIFSSITVSSILARRLFTSPSMAGVLVALLSVGLAGIPIPLSAYMTKAGRRRGLALGYAVGAAGAAFCIVATASRNIPLLLAGTVLLGGMYGTAFLSRYAAADVVPGTQRARAIGWITWSLVIGALIGPNLLEASGRWSSSAGLPELTGPFVLALAGSLVSALVMWLALRPEPLEVARMIAAQAPGPQGGDARQARLLLKVPEVALAMVSVGVVQLVMVAVMAVTSAHIASNHGSLGLAGFVLSAHFVGMFGLSPVAGMISDRLGAHRGLVAGQLVVAAGGAIAWLFPVEGAALTAALFLIGVGWSFNVVGASAMVTGAVTPVERTKVQGLTDFLNGAVSVVASLIAGALLAGVGFSIMSASGAAIMALPLALVIMRRLPAREH